MAIRSKRSDMPNVFWLATPLRAKVRHAADHIAIEYDGSAVWTKTLCGRSGVFVTDKNDFNNMHQCGRCYEVITDLENTERFFPGNDSRRTK